MSRSGYSDDCDSMLLHINWRGCVMSATRGKRGQAFFRDLVAALDAMPVKRLITKRLENAEGDVCAFGALGRARSVPLADIDALMEDDDDGVPGDVLGERFGIARQLASEVVYENDERFERQTPEERWQRMRNWAAKQIRVTPDELMPLTPDESERAEYLSELNEPVGEGEVERG